MSMTNILLAILSFVLCNRAFSEIEPDCPPMFPVKTYSAVWCDFPATNPPQYEKISIKEVPATNGNFGGCKVKFNCKFKGPAGPINYGACPNGLKLFTPSTYANKCTGTDVYLGDMGEVYFPHEPGNLTQGCQFLLLPNWLDDKIKDYCKAHAGRIGNWGVCCSAVPSLQPEGATQTPPPYDDNSDITVIDAPSPTP